MPHEGNIHYVQQHCSVQCLTRRKRKKGGGKKTSTIIHVQHWHSKFCPMNMLNMVSLSEQIMPNSWSIKKQHVNLEQIVLMWKSKGSSKVSLSPDSNSLFLQLPFLIHWVSTENYRFLIKTHLSTWYSRLLVSGVRLLNHSLVHSERGQKRK